MWKTSATTYTGPSGTSIWNVMLDGSMQLSWSGRLIGRTSNLLSDRPLLIFPSRAAHIERCRQ